MIQQEVLQNSIQKLFVMLLIWGQVIIHIEPRFQGYAVRFRISGILKEVLRLPPRVESAIITRYKVLAKMDIAEHRRPQDGTFSLKYNNISYDFRINTLPVNGKEKMVIRVLAPAASISSDDKKISLIGAIMKQHTPAHSFSFLIIKHKLYRNSSDN